MMAKRLRLRLTPQEGLHRDFLMKRAAYLMRKTKRALSAYHEAKRSFYPSSKGETEAQIAAPSPTGPMRTSNGAPRSARPWRPSERSMRRRVVSERRPSATRRSSGWLGG